MSDDEDRSYEADAEGFRHLPTGIPPRAEPTMGAANSEPLRVRRIVVGSDGSESALEAIRHARFIATNFTCTVEVIGAWQIASSINPYVPTQQWSPESDAREVMADAITAVFGAHLPMWLHWSVRQGPAARVLIEASKNADLLIVGSRGHGGVVGLLLGSVSAACAEHSHCPVLIMH